MGFMPVCKHEHVYFLCTCTCGLVRFKLLKKVRAINLDQTNAVCSFVQFCYALD